MPNTPQARGEADALFVAVLDTGGLPTCRSWWMNHRILLRNMPVLRCIHVCIAHADFQGRVAVRPPVAMPSESEHVSILVAAFDRQKERAAQKSRYRARVTRDFLRYHDSVPSRRTWCVVEIKNADRCWITARIIVAGLSRLQSARVSGSKIWSPSATGSFHEFHLWP